MKLYHAWLKERVVRTAVSVIFAAGIFCAPVYGEEQDLQLQAETKNHAAGWEQTEDGWYYYDEAGELQTGWIRAAEDGLWYYLNEETGVWIPRPELDAAASVRLLENAVGKFGYYRNEEEPLIFREDYRDKHAVYLTVRKMTGPDSDSIINSYKVEKRTGNVKPAVGERFNLYDASL
ncbi:hypothetical protein D7X87_00810 [bacterium D16-54]|nr:hypothetical protein D7X87_00810 [bacterium D16-54]RKJ16857.1 hypothetical protein D7X65_00810 [bacterium D16-56]